MINGVFNDIGKCWTAIAREMSDYTQRSLADGSATFGKLMAVTSVEQAIEIQTEFAKRSYGAYVQEVSKIGSLCAELAKGAYGSEAGTPRTS